MAVSPWLHRGLTLAACALASLAAPATTAWAQVPIVRLPASAAWELDSAFTTLRDVRELPNGSVLILDAGDRTVLRYDPGTRRLDQIGRVGSGPGEYQLPVRLFPLVGGTTGVHDPPNGRILVLDASGRPEKVVSDRVSQPSTISHLAPTQPSGSDTLGRFYSQAQSAALRPGGTWQAVEAAAVERWIPESALRDTVAMVPIVLPPGVFVSQGIVAAPAEAPMPFTRVAQWAVALDGWVAVVHPDPYRVEFFGPDETRRRGSPVIYTPVRLTAGHKEAWRTEQSRPRFQTVYRGSGDAPSVRLVTPRVAEPRRWPVVLPPTTGETPQFDAAGRLWVGRSVAAGAAPRYDVFSRSARHLAQVELPGGSRLLGFGSQSLYVVRQDADDLEYLAQFPLPGLPRR